ncbi:hypothetical protein IMAU30078_01114 [Lactobacillus helveticus]|nr:hypothetical protein [Lactobacillus helveticus]
MINNYKSFVHKHWIDILAVVLIAIMVETNTLILNFPIFSVCKRFFLLNLCLWFLIYKFFQAISNNYWISLTIATSLNLLFLFGTILKIKFRNEPILPADLKMLGNLPALLKMVPISIVGLFLIIVIALIIVCVILSKKVKVPKLNRLGRTFWTLVPIMILGSSVIWNRPNTVGNKLVMSLIQDPMFWDQTQGVQKHGPVIQFLSNVDMSVMNKPAEYSETKIQHITNKYKRLANEINQERKHYIKDQTIIFNLSESFANPKRVPDISLNSNPIPTIDNLKRKTTSGLMMSSGYGGGTANMEYMTLTGLATCNFSPTLNSPYSQLVPHQTYTPTILNSFDYSVAIHPYTSEFYNRKLNYKKFGFDRFYLLDNKKYQIKHKKTIDNNEYQSDETAYDNLMDELRRHRGGQFINLITMQNHLPYDHLYKKKAVTAKVRNHTSKQELENYATGIHYTDKAVAKAIDEINNISRPITLVFYGDHLPGLYKNNMKKDGLALHKTDYFIYSNKAAIKQGAKRLKEHTKYVAPNDFIAMVLKQTNSKVTPYQALLTKVW